MVAEDGTRLRPGFPDVCAVTLHKTSLTHAHLSEHHAGVYNMSHVEPRPAPCLLLLNPECPWLSEEVSTYTPAFHLAHPAVIKGISNMMK